MNLDIHHTFIRSIQFSGNGILWRYLLRIFSAMAVIVDSLIESTKNSDDLIKYQLHMSVFRLVWSECYRK